MKFMIKCAVAVFLSFPIVSCASISTTSDMYIEKGKQVEKLKGNSFYAALGKVNLYLMGFIPAGTANTAVAIQVNKDTGAVLQIVTVQPAGRDVLATNSQTGAVVYGKWRYKMDDLIGGIVVVEFYKMETWSDALDFTSQNAKR